MAGTAEAKRAHQSRLRARCWDEVRDDAARLRPDGMKACCKCRQRKPLAMFERCGKNTRDGHSSECKECKATRSKVLRRRDPSIQVRHNARRKVRRHTDEEYRIRELMWSRSGYANDAERRRATARERMAARYAADPVGAMEGTRGGHLSRAGVPGTHTHEEWGAVLESFGHRCAYCGADGPLQREHMVPLSRGGSNDIENLVPACRPCNMSKHCKTPLEFFLFGIDMEGMR